MKDIPKKIYLQIGQEDSYDDVESFKEFSEVSWCSHKMHDSDIEYILAGSEPEGKEAVELFKNLVEAAEAVVKEGGYDPRFYGSDHHKLYMKAKRNWNKLYKIWKA